MAELYIWLYFCSSEISIRMSDRHRAAIILTALQHRNNLTSLVVLTFDCLRASDPISSTSISCRFVVQFVMQLVVHNKSKQLEFGPLVHSLHLSTLVAEYRTRAKIGWIS